MIRLWLWLTRCRHRRHSWPITLQGEEMPHVTCAYCKTRQPYSLKHMRILRPAEAIEEYWAHGHFWPVREYALTLTSGPQPEDGVFDYHRLEPDQQFEVDNLSVGDAISFGGRFTVTRIN